MIQDDKFMEAYYKYMTDMAVILGADRKRAAKELKESLEFEIKLAKVCTNICMKYYLHNDNTKLIHNLT